MEVCILCKEDINNKVDREHVLGLALISGYTKQPTKNGGFYLGGNVECLGTVPFKVWQGDCFCKMEETDFSGKICHIVGKVNEFGGTKQLILDDIVEISQQTLTDNNIKKSDFLETKYNIESYWNLLIKTLQKSVTPEAMQVFNLVMDKEITERFKEEFAAVSHHDNCRGGLLAHTTKVVKLSTVISMYPNILSRVSPDLLYIGAALHDIGKIVEYNNGVVSPIGKAVSHLAIGIYMLEKHREEIINLKGEDFYYSLISIISQHHGEYGEAPRTVAAYVIHQLDCLDSTLTLLDEVSMADGQISFDSMKLS